MSMDWGDKTHDPLLPRKSNETDQLSQAINEKTPDGKTPARTSGLGNAMRNNAFVQHSASSITSSSGPIFGGAVGRFGGQRLAGNTYNSAYSGVPRLSQGDPSKKTPINPAGYSLSVNNNKSPSPPTSHVENIKVVDMTATIISGTVDRPSVVKPSTKAILQNLHSTPQAVVKPKRGISDLQNSLANPILATAPSVPIKKATRPVEAKKKSKEVVDLLDDDDDDDNVGDSENVSSQVGKKYGTKSRAVILSSVADGRNTYSGYVDGVCEYLDGSHLYLGLKLHHSEMRHQRLRLMTATTSCIELLLTTETDGDAPTFGSSFTTVTETIPLHNIQSIQCSEPDSTANESFIAILVSSDVHLRSVTVGPNGMLDPDLKVNVKDNPAKYILMVTTVELVQRFVESLDLFPDWKAKFVPLKHPFAIKSCATAHLHPEGRLKAYESLTRASTRKNRRKKSTAVIDFTDPADCIVHVVYPTEIDALDAITIYTGDLKRLQPCEYLNDNLIDLKIKHMINGLDEAKRARVHAFSCLFYGKLTEIPGKDFKAAHTLVSRWTKNLNLFNLDFIVIPINLTFHWSVCFLTNPKLLLAKMDEYVRSGGAIIVDSTPPTPSPYTPGGAEGGGSGRTSTPVGEEEAQQQQLQQPVEECRLLFMDSLNMHPMATIAKAVKHYLFHEWETRIRNPATKDEEKMNDRFTNGEQKAAAAVGGGADSGSIDGLLVPSYDVEKATKYFVDSIPHMKCGVPTQPNGFDCGVYVIKYVEMVLNTWPTAFTRRTSGRKNVPYTDDKINKIAFKQSDVDEERENLHALLNGLHDEWLMVREQYKAEHGGEDPAEGGDGDSPQSPGFHAIPDPAILRVIQESLNEATGSHKPARQSRSVGENILEKSSDEDELHSLDNENNNINENEEEDERSLDDGVGDIRVESSVDSIDDVSGSSSSSSGKKDKRKKRRKHRDVPVNSTEDIPRSLNNDFLPTESTVVSDEGGEAQEGSVAASSVMDGSNGEVEVLPKSKKRRIEKV